MKQLNNQALDLLLNLVTSFTKFYLLNSSRQKEELNVAKT